MLENVDGRTDDGVTGILIAHLGAFGSGELKRATTLSKNCEFPPYSNFTCILGCFTLL